MFADKLPTKNLFLYVRLFAAM